MGRAAGNAEVRMTYIVGLKKQGVTAIICDVIATFENKDLGQVLKNGILFPGCIYGASGNSLDIAHFIDFCRAAFPDKVKDYLQAWSEFEKVVSLYDEYKTRDFEFILSSRHSGKPALYTLSSQKESHLQTITDDFISIGSGKKYLDKGLEEFHAELQRTPTISTEVPSVFFPYPYCLWLMEKARGEEALLLQNTGVGGFFHFACQLDDTEVRQDPALYLLNRHIPGYKLDDQRVEAILTYVYRVSFLHNGKVLSIENGDDNMLELVLQNEAVKSLKAAYPDFELAKKELLEELRKQHEYSFCGVGFLDKEARLEKLMHFKTPDRRESIIDRTQNPWIVRPDVRLKIEAVFNKVRQKITSS